MSDGTSVDIYEPVIAALKAQNEENLRMIEWLELRRNVVAGVQALGPIPAPTQQNVGAAFSNDSFFGMTIGEGAKKFLSATKKTATARAIAEALVAGGFKTTAKNFIENVRSILSRSPLFVLVNGQFGLAEWYPGRKTTPKKAGAATQEEVEELTPEKAFGPASIVRSPPPLQ